MAVSFHKPAIPFVPVSRRLVSSFTILTTAAKHERVPVILHPEECGRLLDWSLTDPTGLSGLFLPYPAELLEMWPVSPLVNTPKHDGCELIAPPKTRGNFVCTMQKSE